MIVMKVAFVRDRDRLHPLEIPGEIAKDCVRRRSQEKARALVVGRPASTSRALLVTDGGKADAGKVATGGRKPDGGSAQPLVFLSGDSPVERRKPSFPLLSNQTRRASSSSMDQPVPERSSIPSGENSVWTDISPLLAAACRDLEDGELIHGDNFNLFAAMSALEIMDPKMDSGIVCKYYSVDEAIENGAAPVPISFDKTDDVRCTIDIMDHLLACEEEDLFTMNYGLPLNGNGDDKCLSMLNAVEETSSRQLRAYIEPLQTNLDLEEGYCKALLCRLRFRKHFYHVLVCLRRPQGRGLELARKHIASCISELESVLSSSEFLRSSASLAWEDGLENKTTASGCQPIGFDASLNCRLSAPTPPRAIKILSWKEAVEYFLKLLHDLDILCLYSLEPSLESILNFVVQFQKSQPDLVARAHLQLLLVQDGKIHGRDPVFSIINRAAALPEATKNHDIQKNEFILQLGQLEMAFKKECGENPNMSIEENAWVKIFQHILVWVEEQTYWIASRFLILGFELELYSPSEYSMVYWYLYVVLVKLAEKIHIKTAAANGSGKRRGKKKRDTPKDAAKDYRIPPAVLFLQCQICLAEGLTMMLAALTNEHRILQSRSPFNTEHERFIQHFELLQKASIPDHIAYPSFKASTSYARFSNLLMYNYFKDAQRIAKEVKSSFSNEPEKLAELRRLEQVAEHNSIAMNVICRVGTLDPSLKVSFEFNHHPYFATAVVKRS
ncbi:hypothetical protein TIFTF001_016419 [Ficus carica]|uniref:N-alpha-acetyltransferase 35, NatC auxiliary subunit n=1 Tax=Ficus carica TaxID=3494 RepID=A0AA88A0B0_FICCA|nr:hypothetical protein TIFTF001_016419 [Ficus carica]